MRDCETVAGWRKIRRDCSQSQANSHLLEKSKRGLLVWLVHSNDRASAMPSTPNLPCEPSAAELLGQIRRLERAARPLEPGASVRKRLRKAVIASSERFLRKIEGQRAYVETEDKGIGLLDVPISERGTSIERVIELFE